MDGISNTHDRIIQKDSGSLFDAFGRLRVSGPYTLFDSQNRYFMNNKFYSNVTGSGSVTYLSSESSVLLSVSGGNIKRETKNVFAYQPGKSLLILSTFVMTDGPDFQRVGYYNDLNGVFVEKSSDIFIVLRNNGVDTKVSQSQWNVYKCPGLDLTKVQIFWIDIEWLGAGSVRTGFVIDGKFITVHSVHNANRINSVYMTTAILPVRYEISGSGTMKQICTSVISEGGYDPKLPLFVQVRGTTDANAVSLLVAGTQYPIISLRLKTGYFDSIVKPKVIDILTLSNQNVSWYLILNPVLTGSSWGSHTNSNIIEVDTSATSLSGGTIIMSGYVSQKSTVQIPSDELDFTIGRTNLASDILTLAITPFNNNVNACAMIGWIQF